MAATVLFDGADETTAAATFSPALPPAQVLGTLFMKGIFANRTILITATAGAKTNFFVTRISGGNVKPFPLNIFVNELQFTIQNNENDANPASIDLVLIT